MKSPNANQAFSILKLLRTIIETHDSLANKLNNIVEMIVNEFGADAGSFYIDIDGKLLELFASYGYASDSLPEQSIKVGEDIIGTVAKQNCSQVITDATKIESLARFVKGYKSFLGVPLIRRRRPLGVLAIQNKDAYEYSSIEVEILETISMVLSDVVSSDEMDEFKKDLIKSKGLKETNKIKGTSLSKGYGIGNAVIHKRSHQVTKIFAEDKSAELEKLSSSHIKMNEDLEEKFNSTKLGIGEHVDILETYQMLAKDKGWYKKLCANVESGLTAEAAVERAYEDMWNRLSGTTDSYLKERLHDLRDISDRLLSYVRGDFKSLEEIEGKDIIVVAQIMGPADLMDYDYTKIKGLIIEDGTPTMHVSIVAKALGIPVIAKIKGLYDVLHNGQLIAVDGVDGYVYLSPSKQIRAKIQDKLQEKLELEEKLNSLRDLPAETLDNKHITMLINVGLSFDLDYIEKTNCDGVGLYRTEIPFMSADVMPDVNKQQSYYQDLIDKCGDKKVIFRTLDVGSDKLLPYWGSVGEENPAIGWRSIRITLDRRAILRKQIRAFIRASVDKELNVMFPMVTNLNEFEEAKETLLLELEKEKIKTGAVPKKVNIGLMIEVPALLYQLDAILEQADFISIGTNDLAQFLFACDRGNPRLSDRYDVLSSPFLTMMKEIITKANKAGVYCSVCGEMAGNPIEAMVLIGLGFRRLSMSGSSFGRVKSMIRSINVLEIEDYVETLLKSSKKTLRPQLISYANDHGIEIY